MGVRRFKLGAPESAAVIDKRYAEEPDGWKKTRLLAEKLTAKGEYTSAELAELCGIARPYFFKWLKLVRTGGIEALLTRGKPGPRRGGARGVKPEVIDALGVKLAAQEFSSAEDARRWLKEEHGVERQYHTVWQWLKKFGGVLRDPRPSHSKKDPARQRRSKARWRKSSKRLKSGQEAV